MLNFRLKVFSVAAAKLNFSEAADELFISQPAVSKHIKELESEFGIALFNRMGGRVELTTAGLRLLGFVEQMLELEKSARFDINLLQQKYSGQLRLGASTTIGQYILPGILAQFYQKYPDVSLQLFNDNTARVEKALVNGEIDFGLIEGSSKNSRLKYVPFTKDEIVAVVHSSQPLAKLDELSIQELLKTPVVLREVGSGSLEVIADHLRQHSIRLKDLNIVMHLGSTESIKSFLASSNTLGLMSVSAVSKEVVKGDYKIIDIKDLSITRTFYFIHPHGALSGLSEVFMKFAKTSYSL